MFNNMKDLYFNEHILSNKLIEKVKDSDAFKEFVSIYNQKETIAKEMLDTTGCDAVMIGRYVRYSKEIT